MKKKKKKYSRSILYTRFSPSIHSELFDWSGGRVRDLTPRFPRSQFLKSESLLIGQRKSTLGFPLSLNLPPTLKDSLAIAVNKKNTTGVALSFSGRIARSAGS